MTVKRPLLASVGFLLSTVSLFGATTIKGGRMELLNKGEEVVFRDGVKLVQGGDTMTAREMRTNRTRDQVTALGDVRLIRKVSSTETWKASGRTGFYDTKTGSGYLEGGERPAQVTQVAVLSSTMTRVVDVYADRIDFFREDKDVRAVAVGSVEGRSSDPRTGDKYVFFAAQANFDTKAGTIILSGTPPACVQQLSGEDSALLTGDVITYYTETQCLISEGNAEAVFEDAGPPRTGKP